jgi:hypothetical protein
MGEKYDWEVTKHILNKPHEDHLDELKWNPSRRDNGRWRPQS